MKKNSNSNTIEKQTVELMIKIYCRHHHNHKNIFCAECEKLRVYAFKRLDVCVYGKKKPACRKCKTHCYAPLMKDQIIKIMRFAGPRMMYKHPIYTFYYIFKSIVIK